VAGGCSSLLSRCHPSLVPLMDMETLERQSHTLVASFRINSIQLNPHHRAFARWQVVKHKVGVLSFAFSFRTQVLRRYCRLSTISLVPAVQKFFRDSSRTTRTPSSCIPVGLTGTGIRESPPTSHDGHSPSWRNAVGSGANLEAGRITITMVGALYFYFYLFLPRVETCRIVTVTCGPFVDTR
jgi:hypothetical protein